MTNLPVHTPKSSTLPTTPGWDSFRTEMEKLMNRFTDAFDFPSLKPIHEVGTHWPNIMTGFAGMAVDVTEDDKAYRIAAELPGLDQKDVDVSIDGDAIVIKGEKSEAKEKKDKNIYLSERSYGVFRRAFALPADADRSAIAADFAKGVLTVSIPKSPAAQKAQKIAVKAA